MTTRLLRISSAALVLAAAGIACTASSGGVASESGQLLQSSPQAAVEELLAADRAFSSASARTDVVSGLTAMFAEDVILPVPGTLWADGLAMARTALQSNPDNAKSSVEWTPIRGGISADGRHGFTFGYMTLRKPDQTTASAKYLSYWVKGPSGWRVAAYKRRPNASVPPPLSMPPALPARIISVIPDPSQLVQYRSSVSAAEQSFSDEAQRIGIGPAFTKWGSADAVNMGGGPSFVVGSQVIGGEMGPATTSPVSWKADRAIVAASGDLGITFGLIKSNSNAADKGIPFFTIWRRASPNDQWRYVAE